MRVGKKLSYAKDAKQVKVQVVDERAYPRDQMENAGQAQHNNLIIEKKNLLTFIAEVINSTVGVEPKTQKIQRIVKATVHHLGLIGLTWDEVRDNLQAKSRQESCGESFLWL